MGTARPSTSSPTTTEHFQRMNNSRRRSARSRRMALSIGEWPRNRPQVGRSRMSDVRQKQRRRQDVPAEKGAPPSQIAITQY